MEEDEVKGSEFLAGLPDDPTQQREQAILEALVANAARISWVPLTVSGNGHAATVLVAQDALSVGDATDWVRVTANMTTAQRVADALDALLLTAKISDLIFQQSAIRLTPCLQRPDSAMATTSRMLRHHTDVETKRANRQGLVSTVGKDWVITDRLKGRPDRAANYGWHDVHAPNGRFWQPVGLAHNRFHVDYSQVLRLVQRKMIVDGIERDMVDVLKDPDLAGLISDEGPIEAWRLAAVPFGGNVPTVVLPAPAPPEPAAPVVATTPAPRPPQSGQAAGPYRFVQARNFKAANRVVIDWIVIHTMEAIEKPTTGEAVANWFAGPNAPMASAHFCIDSDSTVQCVLEKDIAFHAPGANGAGIGLEHAGYAKQSAEDWADDYSEAMLQRSAELTADLCRKYGIPVAFIDAAGLIAGERGITTHRAVSAAFKKSTHTDPGPNFPMDHYLELVRRLM